MKILTSLLLSVGLTSAAFGSTESADLKKNKPVIVAPAFWCPYSCDAKAKDRGIQVEIIESSLKKEGVDIDYKNMPYDRALDQLKKGKIDGITGPFKEEAPFAIFTEGSVSATIFCFYGKKDSKWTYSGPASLKGKKLAYTSGYAYSTDVDKYINDNPKMTFALKGEKIFERGAKLVRAGRADVLLNEDPLAAFEGGVDKHKVKKISCLDNAMFAYLGIQPVHKKRANALKDAFDKGYKKIVASGELKAILKKYGINYDDWKAGM